MKIRVFKIVSLFVLLFVLFGYPIQVFVPYVLKIDSTPINLVLRQVMFFTSLIIIIIYILFSYRGYDLKKGFIFFSIFWVIYGIRLIYDLEIVGLRYIDKNSFYVYSFAFGVCLTSSVLAFYIIPSIDLLKFIKISYIFIFISNLCLTYAILSFSLWNFSESLLSRANLIIEIDGKEQSIVNPITIGVYGQLLASLAIHVLFFHKKISKKNKILLVINIIHGLINLILGASRGPILVFVIIFILQLYLFVKYNRKSFSFLFYLFFSMLLFFMSFQLFVNSSISNIEFVNRFSIFLENRKYQEKEERDYEWSAAWDQFVSNPLLGDAFVNSYDKSYSHNLILDVLMSTGIVGLFIFCGILYFVFKRIKNILKNLENKFHESMVVVVFLSSFLISMTSGSLFMSSGFWISISVILALNRSNVLRTYFDLNSGKNIESI